MENTTNDTLNTVLIVDDNQDNLLLFQAIFDSAGFRVLSADSALGARKILTDDPHSVDLVLSDISMPGETGFDLLSWIRSSGMQTEQIPVLLITAALPEESNRIKGLALGAVDYIVRPINNQELILRVRNALEHFKQFRALQRSLETSEDMANTGRILAAANHEIRNLVGLIHISTEQALFSAERGEPILPGTNGFRALSALAKMTEMLTNVSRDLNAHINAERIRTKNSSIRAIIDELLTITKLKLHGVSLDVASIDEQYFVLADATRVKQILLNFALNALDAIEEKGSRNSGRIEIRVTESSKEHLQIRIKDNGIGLLEEGRRSEFHPFKTTKAIRGGKGLGLWLCARLAKGMDGQIFLESKGPATGTTAILELRRSHPPIEEKLKIEDYFVD